MAPRGTKRPAGSAPVEQLDITSVAGGPPLGRATTPTLASILGCLTEPRVLALHRVFGSDLRDRSLGKVRVAQHLAEHLAGRMPALLRELGRDELRAVASAHGLPIADAARPALLRELLLAAGLDPDKASVRPPPLGPDALPEKGQVVHLRHRQWLVQAVAAGEGRDSPKVSLVCLDDDDPGRPLEVLWDLELGARIAAEDHHGFGVVDRLDPPAAFGAYLHALKWSAVSAADASRFQAPFRAGIKLSNYQLTPLMKALELPRANLFIADDVGLGKTIEAGLVLSELILRQQAGFVLVACPASVCLQWQTEMQRRFGLRFEVMTRQLVSRKQQAHGFGVNPWATHNRWIVSHALLRRPEYRDRLLLRLGARAHKGLFILDEAHAAAPASAAKYATDTELTLTVRDLAPRFDNRLFLSATPHNGHSNSFSALLELLDPARFSRGVKIDGKRDLAPVMVRRLKRDLRKLGVEQFPKRVLVEVALTNDAGAWTIDERRFDAESGERVTSVADGAFGETTLPTASASGTRPPELELSELLARYTELAAPTSGQGRLPFIQLQQRLLSSPEAFARTLEAHLASLRTREAKRGSKPPQRAKARVEEEVSIDPDLHGRSEEDDDEDALGEVERATSALPDPTEEVRAILERMEKLADAARRRPDAKVQAFLAWARSHLCPGIGVTEERTEERGAKRAWTQRRVILFTEYADTKKYWMNLLAAAVAHTDDAEGRIRSFHGGMGDDARAEVQRDFNADPSSNPLRILVATDAAREGVNLQGACADLFHIDLPWNPSRLEQRNGRIDRTLQPSPEVRCRYFVLPQRAEDRVLETVQRKIRTVERELGSLGAVVLSQLERLLEGGLQEKLAPTIDALGTEARPTTNRAGPPPEALRRAAVHAELEAHRDDLETIRAEVARAGARLEASRRSLAVEPDSLRGVVDVGLGLAGAEPMRRAGVTSDGKPTFTLPALDPSWAVTLDTLRPPRGRDQAFHEWRRVAPRDVTFHPLTKLHEDAEQLHLSHPLVKRVLDRFLAQGFSAHDLSRVTAVLAPNESVIRVVCFARLTLFGPSAARLHDQLVTVAAAWQGGADAVNVRPYKDRATAVNSIASVERLLAQDSLAQAGRSARTPNATILARIRAHAPALFLALWPALLAEADDLAAEAKRGLAERARREGDDLEKLLRRQEKSIDGALRDLRQGGMARLFEGASPEALRAERRQLDKDVQHLEERLAAIATEIRVEPEAVRALYDVGMQRITPVGLVIAWPEGMS